MKLDQTLRGGSIGLAAALVAGTLGPVCALAADGNLRPSDDQDGGLRLTSARTGVRFLASSVLDTFYLYGGPASVEGKFQDELGAPRMLGHAPHAIVPGEWFGVDLTDPTTGDQAPYVGDFSWIVPAFTDVDPCRDNPTPLVGFLDDGRCPANQDNNGGAPPCQSTGGTTMLSDPYGVPGGWAVNYTGGLSLGQIEIRNEVWSPPIAWDLPGTADDAVEVAGARLRFSVWRHLPLLTHDLFYVWHVRTSQDGGSTWSEFADDGFFYFGSIPRWVNLEFDVSRHVNALGPPTHVQIALGVLEFEFGPPGATPTPSPLFDNVSLLKYRVGGPVISATEANTFMDAFPQSGNADFATLAGREVSDCRLDVGDVNTGLVNVPGDSMIVDVVPTIPGTTVQDVRAVWVLDVNPLFEDVRVMPSQTTVVAAGALSGWDQWFGETAAHPIASLENRWSIELPDEDFLHPGDELRYYVQATDDGARVSTLPAELQAFETGRSGGAGRYDLAFTVRALPTVVEDLPGLSQPSILVVNAGRSSDWAELFLAFDQNAATRGVDYDVYTVRAPTQRVSNGIGSSGAHGATANQLSGYEVILYATENVALGPSDGSDVGNHDKGDDLGVLSAWFGQDADRAIAHFGDDLVTWLTDQAGLAGATYAQSILGVDGNGDDVSVEIGQTAPRVLPSSTPACFTTDFVAYGGCPLRKAFDSIAPRAGAAATHVFADGQGTALPGPAAGVLWSRTDANGNAKNSAVFPYGLASIWDPSLPDSSPQSARSLLLRELVEGCFAGSLGTGAPVAADGPPVVGPHRLTAAPNPFNGIVTISFELGVPSDTTVRIFDARGQLVRALHAGKLGAGPQRFRWNGRDDNDKVVASGVYFVHISAAGRNRSVKTVYLQ